MPLSDLAQSVDFSHLDEPLAEDMHASLRRAVAGGVVFEGGAAPLDIFCHAVDTAIRDIDRHPRGELFRRFVVQGPYEGEGEFPTSMNGERLTDEETAKAIRFVYSWMVNSFQGRLAELLTAGPMLDLLERLKVMGEIPGSARLFVGDAVTAPRVVGAGRVKAADLHVLSERPADNVGPRVIVHALGEVKSHPVSERRVRRQLAGHVVRCRRGLIMRDEIVAAERVDFEPDPPLIVWAEPAAWSLPRGFDFVVTDGDERLRADLPHTPAGADEAVRESDGAWRLTLRWSHEALAAAAYEMTFWYMERVGDVVFAESSANPWPEMSPSEAGRNAAKQSLYYAIRRARTRHEHDRAVALYNMYGFGYALGMNFRGPDGRRKMLWWEHLRAIRRNGVSDDGARFWG